MLKVCYGSELKFPTTIIENEFSKYDNDTTYMYSFNSVGNNIAKSIATNNNIRVIMSDCSDTNRISGIIELLNRCNIVLLFYDEIQYSTGLDLIKQCCIVYKIPLKIINSNNDSKKFNSYPKPKLSVRNIDYRKINYKREENKNDLYDKEVALFKIMTSYDRISSKKKSKQIRLLETTSELRYNKDRFKTYSMVS